MEAKGWLKLHRKLQLSEVFNDPDLLRLWMLCLMKASHSERLVEWQGEKINLLPGQFLTGRSALDEDYNEGLSAKRKVKPTTLWNWIKKLEALGSLKIEAIESRKCSKVTLVNWDEHQARDEDPGNEDPAPLDEKEEVSEEMGDFLKAGEESGTDLTPAPKVDKPKKKEKGKRVYEKTDIEYKLAGRLFYWMLKNNPKAKYPDPQKWSNTFRLMMERDDRSAEDIQAVIDWSQNNDFWMANILSPEKLRKQFDTLYIQREKELKKKTSSSGGSRGAKKNDLLREMMEKEARNNGQIGNNKTLFLDN